MQSSWTLSYLHLSHRLASTETRRILETDGTVPQAQLPGKPDHTNLVNLISDYELIRQDKEKVASAVKTHALPVQRVPSHPTGLSFLPPFPHRCPSLPTFSLSLPFILTVSLLCIQSCLESAFRRVQTNTGAFGVSLWGKKAERVRKSIRACFS